MLSPISSTDISQYKSSGTIFDGNLKLTHLRRYNYQVYPTCFIINGIIKKTVTLRVHSSGLQAAAIIWE
jgi:hypothetical protein